MTRPDFKVVVLALALLINSIVSLLFLFVPKLYALYTTKQGQGSTARSIEDRSELNLQMVSNSSFSGVFRAKPGSAFSSFKDHSHRGKSSNTHRALNSNTTINSNNRDLQEESVELTNGATEVGLLSVPAGDLNIASPEVSSESPTPSGGSAQRLEGE